MVTCLHRSGLGHFHPESVQNISIIKLCIGGPDCSIQTPVQLVLRHLACLVAEIRPQEVHQGLDEVSLAQEQVALQGVAVLHKAVLGEDGVEQVLVNGCCCVIDCMLPRTQLYSRQLTDPSPFCND